MSINVHFTNEDWERHERNWSAWWAGELDRPLIMIETIEPSVREQLPAAHDFVANYPLEMAADEVLDRYQAWLEARRFHGDAWPRWVLNYGAGIIAGFLGAKLEAVPETVWFWPTEKVPLEEMQLRFDAENIWWRRVRELTSLAVERWGHHVTVSHTDLGGNLDILASLDTTEQLLLDLYDAPGEVARLVQEITRLWVHYYDELHSIIRKSGRGTTPWAPIWSPGRCYMLQCDFCYMISPEMFERFVLPDIAACCDALDHGFYHLDGKGEIPHLDMLLSLERLRGIQWIPGDGAPPPEEWLPLLKRIRDAGKLCQLFVTADGARTIVRELGGRGFALYILDEMTNAEAEDFLHTLGPS